MKLPKFLIPSKLILLHRPDRTFNWTFTCLALITLCLAACQVSAGSSESNQTTPTPKILASPTHTPAETAPPIEPVGAITAAPLATQTPAQTVLPKTVTPTEAAFPFCLQEAGRMETGSFHSDQLKLPMEYRIWLPPCYDSEPEQRFPLLLMVHGQNYNEDQWDRLGIDEAAENLIQAGEIPPFIIAMPRDRNWQQPSQDAFGDVVVDEFLPWLDSSYRTITERQFRAVGGLSRGAGWAVHLGLSHWELFGAVGGHSLPVFWEDTSKIRRWLEDIPASQMPRIYLDIGDHDRPEITKSAVWFEQLLTDLGIAHEWHLYVGFHEEAYWESHVEEYVRWYSLGWIK